MKQKIAIIFIFLALLELSFTNGKSTEQIYYKYTRVSFCLLNNRGTIQVIALHNCFRKDSSSYAIVDPDAFTGILNSMFTELRGINWERMQASEYYEYEKHFGNSLDSLGFNFEFNRTLGFLEKMKNSITKNESISIADYDFLCNMYTIRESAELFNETWYIQNNWLYFSSDYIERKMAAIEGFRKVVNDFYSFGTYPYLENSDEYWIFYTIPQDVLKSIHYSAKKEQSKDFMMEEMYFNKIISKSIDSDCELIIMVTAE